MGSGKSYTGKQLAERLSYDFQDLDDAIEAKAGKTIREIFADEGEAHFRQLERQCLQKLGEQPQLVVATGGGAPCFFDNMELMNAAGLTIFLDTSVETLVQRLKPEIAHRPLLAGKSDAELQEFITQKLSERRPFYEQAKVLYHQQSATEAVAEQLEKVLQEMNT